MESNDELSLLIGFRDHLDDVLVQVRETLMESFALKKLANTVSLIAEDVTRSGGPLFHQQLFAVKLDPKLAIRRAATQTACGLVNWIIAGVPEFVAIAGVEDDLRNELMQIIQLGLSALPRDKRADGPGVRLTKLYDKLSHQLERFLKIRARLFIQAARKGVRQDVHSGDIDLVASLINDMDLFPELGPYAWDIAAAALEASCLLMYSLSQLRFGPEFSVGYLSSEYIWARGLLRMRHTLFSLVQDHLRAT